MKFKDKRIHVFNFSVKKSNIFFLLLLIMALSIPIAHYPRIFGVDAFQVMWMANAIREGALFSEPTWLIHPTSYFGYYPFSHRAIGVPILLAFLLNFVEFVSFGYFGMAEAVLLLDMIFIVVLYKSAKSLGKSIFKEEWSRFIFVAGLLLSADLIYDTKMTVSTRIVITIVIILLLKISLLFIQEDGKEKQVKLVKRVVYLIILLLIAALAHRLWMGMFVVFGLLVLTLIIRNFENLQHISVFLILPIAIVAFFYGLETFEGLFQVNLSTLGDIMISLTWFYFKECGFILILLPIGVFMGLYNLTYSFKNSKELKLVDKDGKLEEELRSEIDDKDDDFDLKSAHKKSTDTNYFLFLFLIPLSFGLVNTFYNLVLYLPIVMIFGVQGLIYLKNYLSSFSKKLEWLIPLTFVIPLIIYAYYRIPPFTKINLWGIIYLSLFFFVLFILIFIILNLDIFNRLNFDFKVKSSELKQLFLISIFSVSAFTFSVMTVELNREYHLTNPYPWINTSLMEEDIEIIDYFQNVELEGLIFTFNTYLGERLAGVGFLPIFAEPTYVGIPLYYNLISPKEIYKKTSFSLSDFERFILFNYTGTDPISNLRNSISNLNLTEKEDFDTFISYNIQFIITANKTFIPGGINNWILIESLKKSDFVYSNIPILLTKYLVIWRIY